MGNKTSRKSVMVDENLVIENNKGNNNINVDIKDKNLRNSVIMPNNKNEQKLDKRRDTVSVINTPIKTWEPWMFQLKLDEQSQNNNDHKSEMTLQTSHTDPKESMYLADYSIPKKFAEISSEIQNISFGKNMILFLTKEGLIYSWGEDKNTLGRDDGEKLELIYFAHKVVKISCGDMFSAIVTESGTLFTFGKNEKGCCGFPGESIIKKPTQVDIKFHVAEVSCGRNHTLVLSKDGNVYSCGDNSHGQLGLSDERDRVVFDQIKYLFGLPIISISAGANHSICLSASGSVYCWGDNRFGQCTTKFILLPNNQRIENPPKINFPYFVIGFLNLAVIKICAKEDQTFVITENEASPNKKIE
eukprot:TRINITY_DN4433_c0_g1_i1.p1 TRINITY_DN4433_c0_g1~~TRINITY_DN4433_c0_g1_i1.p1  ORF type:complete len:359 (-),score=86.13 TRINITY_DN4433_c0_g1_i1:191-1267(-)